MLEVKSNTKGFLPPRMTSSQRNSIVAPVSGLLIYNSDCNDMQFYNSAEWIPVGKTGMLATPGLISGSTSAGFNSGQATYSIAPVPGATGYSWSVPQGTSIISGQGTTSITVAYGSASGSVCVAAYSDCYRSVVNCLGLSLSPTSPLELSIEASATTVCVGSAVTYTATPVNAGSAPIFQWKVNGVNSGQNQNTFAYIPQNHDEVSCVLTTSSSVVTGDSAVSNIISMEVLTPATVSVAINALPHPDCNNSPFTFVAIPVNGGDNPTYQWSLNEELVSGATNSTFSTSMTGVVACQVTSNSPCIIGNATASNFLETGDCSVVGTGETINLYCTLVGCDNAGAVFNWVNASGSWQSSERDPVIEPGENGYASDIFYLTVTFSPPAGSYSQGAYFIQVTP
jgi:hypothetical protein